MIRPHNFLAAIAFCVLVQGASAAPFWRSKYVPITVVVDFTPEGRKLTHPTPSAPAYYFPIASAFQELGEVEAGVQPPDQNDMLHSIAVALAAQGYKLSRPGFLTNDKGQLVYGDGTTVIVPVGASRGRGRVPIRQLPLTAAMLNAPDGEYSMAATTALAKPATGEAPPLLRVLRTVDKVHGSVLARMPSLILVFAFGYMKPSMMALGNGQEVMFNRGQMLDLVAGNTMSHIIGDFAREMVMQASSQERYFMMVTAYDYGAYAASRKKVILWTAKISTPTQGGEQFSDIAPALVAAGANSFGLETRKPVTVTLDRSPDGKVDIGPLTVKGVSDPSPGTSAAKQ